jgi:predicted Zn-dependent peptidase
MAKIAPDTAATTYERTVLPNGLRVLTSSLPYTNAVSINFLFGAGSRYETDPIAGASHLFEHMLFKGTTRRQTPREISEVVEGVGGALNAFTDREITGYWCRLAKPHYRSGIDLIADMVQNSLIRQEDIDREKQVVYEEIRSTNDSPGGRVGVILEELLWPSQALGRDVAGTVESVAGISRETMLEYLHTQYVARNTVISIAGDVQHDEIVAQISDLMGDFKDGEPLAMSSFVDNLSGPVAQVETRPTEQAHVAIGLHGLSMNDPDRHALGLLSVILGESMSSRLFDEIREKRGLAYDIHSSVHALADTGLMVIESGIDPERVSAAVPVIVEEVARMREGITEREFLQAKELSKGRMLLRMEESRAVAAFLGGQELLKGDVRTVEQVINDIDAVELDDIASVAKRVIKSDKMTLAMVGPFDDPTPFVEAMKF